MPVCRRAAVEKWIVCSNDEKACAKSCGNELLDKNNILAKT